MRNRHLVSLGTLAAGVFGLLAFTGTSMVAQAPAPAKPGTAKPAAATTQQKPAPAARSVPRTPWGTPDLQGTWFVTENVPFERAQGETREFLTDEEVAKRDAQNAASQGRNTRAGAGTTQDVEGAYNAAFNSILRTGKRTSRIIDPPDGRIPPLVGGGQGGGQGGGRGGRGGGGAAAPGAAPGAGAAPGGAAAGRGGAGAPGGAPGQGARGAGGGGGRGRGNDNPEQIAQNPRCLGVQLPFLPINTAFAQGTVMRIVQAQKSVAIYMEDDHAGGGNRVIYLDGRPHPPASLRLYLGHSTGRWVGDTLVVETTNLAQGFRNSNPATYKMTERYQRTGPNDLRREITFEDPQTWTRPWTALIEMGKVNDERHMIFESACHEGNYGLMGILVGARLEERAAAGK
jgi:hypothetical protein